MKNENSNNSIFAEIFGTVHQNVGGRDNVYKKEVYQNLLQSERKVFRRIARKKLDGFLAKYLANRKNQEALKLLASEWKQYAAKVYENVSVIYAGTEERQRTLCSEFVEAMANAAQPAQQKKAVKKSTAKKEIKKTENITAKKTEEITDKVTA